MRLLLQPAHRFEKLLSLAARHPQLGTVTQNDVAPVRLDIPLHFMQVDQMRLMDAQKVMAVEKLLVFFQGLADE